MKRTCDSCGCEADLDKPPGWSGIRWMIVVPGGSEGAIEVWFCEKPFCQAVREKFNAKRRAERP
jgi:hypothetical protein